MDELQAAILAGDWAAATKHVARLELPSSQALQVGRTQPAVARAGCTRQPFSCRGSSAAVGPCPCLSGPHNRSDGAAWSVNCSDQAVGLVQSF